MDIYIAKTRRICGFKGGPPYFKKCTMLVLMYIPRLGQVYKKGC